MHVATLAAYMMRANFAESYKQRLAEEIIRPDKLLAHSLGARNDRPVAVHLCLLDPSAQGAGRLAVQ
jgi:hypothetical protein